MYKMLATNDNNDIERYLEKALSGYSAKPGFDEVLSEVCSALISGAGNDFADRFIREVS
ncbi:MAG: hypothetical protein PUE49_06390 [Eggerthellales bacterium]|nr:hypothetical protein [Eggerthellales bacterium]